MTRDPALAESISGAGGRSAAAIPGPFESWLALRGLKTLALRDRPPVGERPRDRPASSPLIRG